MKKLSKIKKIILGILVVLILGFGAYRLPPVYSRLSWRIQDLYINIKNTINPPVEAVFFPSPNPQANTSLATTSTVISTPTLAEATPTQPGPSATTTSTYTPIPEFINLPNVKYVDQFNRWNYCGPANLTMALNYWGWTGTRDDVAAVVKPGIQDMKLDFIQQGRSDKNVLPSELTGFVRDYTNYNYFLRYGGDIDLIKRLVAAGFPVVAEKGEYQLDYNKVLGWMGHYQFITGYEDGVQSLIVQDTYLDGPNFRVPYAKFEEGWRAFDYIFFIVYPPERQAEVLQLLGPWADPNWGYQHSLELANQDIKTLTGVDLYFAWFSKGTSLVKLQQYNEAAIAFDNAFNHYATLVESLGKDNSMLPKRMMWYQTSPYEAYYYSWRYQDVINLANITLSNSTTPTFEESFYWRGMAEYALGENTEGIADLRESVRLNPNFKDGLLALQNIGVQP